MNIRLNRHSEELLQEQLDRGSFRSPEEVIERALEILDQTKSRQFTLGPRTKSASEAVADVLELRRGVALGGLKIKDLINEGRKY